MIECCCGSLKDVITANENRYHRIELNSGLQLGGLTPSIGLIKKSIEISKIPIVVMIRPKAGGFYYNQEEKETILQDLDEILSLDIEGIASGFLNQDTSIDIEFTKEIVNLCHKYGKKFVFHRAFDVIETYSIEQAIEILIKLKVDRILTSGRKSSALFALEELSQLQEKYSNIKIVAGCGIKIKDIDFILNNTNIKEIHGSFSALIEDYANKGNEVDFSSEIRNVVKMEM